MDDTHLWRDHDNEYDSVVPEAGSPDGSRSSDRCNNCDSIVLGKRSANYREKWRQSEDVISSLKKQVRV